MSTPNPLVPEGAIAPSKGKSNVKIAIFTILAIHVVLLGGLLIQGCKPGAKPEAKQEVQPTEQLPPINQAPEAAQAVLPTAEPATTVPATAAATAPAGVAAAAVAAAPANTGPVSLAPQLPSDTTVAPAGDVKTHVVAKGEMLSTIAKKYHVSVKAVQDANPTVNPTKLQIGQKLNIPAPAAKAEGVASAPAADAADVYTVKPGDMLEKIAKANGTTAKEIMRLNNLKSVNRIMPGQKLKLPMKAAAPAAGTAEAAPVPFTTPTPVAAAPATTTAR